jgi:triacylglycerol lipase
MPATPAVARLKAPVVLVHGLFGFAGVQAGARTVLSYFREIPRLLEAAGNRVLTPALSPTAGVPVRAAQLKGFLDQAVGDEPVHVPAHSMGGLDTRWFISRLGGAGRVLSLTTIGTPHRGTPVADWVAANVAPAVKPVCDLLGVPTRAFFDLTTHRCRELNRQMPDAPGVRCFSVAGRFQTNLLQPEWEIPHRIVLRAEGAGDGVVSVASAAWGEATEVWPGDHISLVNWHSAAASVLGTVHDRRGDYARLIGRLRDLGF